MMVPIYTVMINGLHISSRVILLTKLYIVVREWQEQSVYSRCLVAPMHA